MMSARHSPILGENWKKKKMREGGGGRIREIVPGGDQLPLWKKKKMKD